MIDDADITVLPGERVLLGGESGSGKSTLIRAIAGLWPWGEGRIGEFTAPISLADLSARVRRELKADFLQVVGDVNKSIRTVAVACGAAGEFLADAITANADVFLTGELRFHDALTARAAGIAILLPGHYASERPGVEDLADRLAKEFPTCTAWASTVECDPIHLGRSG